MNKIKFTIITVCYNSEKTISRTIQSVLNQTYSPYEYFIIDGASNDNTVHIAKEFENKFAQKGIIYKVISEKDKGMYDALNKGCLLSNGDIIGQINSDDWYENNALEIMAKLYDREKFDMAYADLRMINCDGTSWIKKAKIDRFVNTHHWNHPTQFTKKTVLLKHPYQCSCMSDDLDLMLWIRKHDYRVSTISEIVANFTVEGISHTKSFLDINDRVKTKLHIYLQNGYSFIHVFDIFAVELGKKFLDK